MREHGSSAELAGDGGVANCLEVVVDLGVLALEELNQLGDAGILHLEDRELAVGHRILEGGGHEIHQAEDQCIEDDIGGGRGLRQRLAT